MAKDTSKKSNSQSSETEKLTAAEIRAQKARIAAEKEYDHSLSYANELQKEAVKLLAEQSNYLDGLRKSHFQLNNSTKENVALKQDLARMYTNELQNAQDLLLKRNMVSTGLKGDYAQYLTQYMIQHKITDVEDERLNIIKQQLAERQRITDETTKQVELTETMAEWQLELNEELEGYTMGWEKLKSKMKAIVTDPKMARTVFAVEGLKTLNEGLKKFGEGFTSLREKGLSAGQAMEGQMKSISMMSVLGLSDTKGVLEGMVETYGNVNALSSKEIDQMGHLAHEMGIAGTEAFKLQAGLSQMPGETLQTAHHTMEYANELAKVNGLAPGKIAADMAKNTGMMATYANGGAKGFAKAAVEAHKMGMDLATTAKMADGLLDFENSINKQMEASVLLNKEINFSKAQELALQGKSQEAAAEIMKQVGGSAEFEKMNVLQKKALAEATGMTVEEMAKAIDAQEEYNKYHGEDVSTWKKGLGYAMEWGGKVGGFLKDNGMLLLSGLSVMKQYGGGLNMLKSGWSSITGFLGGAANKIKGMFGKGGPADSATNMIKGAGDKAGNLSSKAKNVNAKQGGGIGGFMKGLASGLKAFGKNAGEVLKGALTFAVSAALLGGALALVALAYQSMGGKPETLIGLGVALAGFGISAAVLGKFSSQIMQGALAMLVLGAALIPAAFAFSLLQNIKPDQIITFSVALPLLGLAAAGLGFLAIPIALGAVALASLGVGMIAVAGGLMVLQAAQGGIEVFNSLTAVAAQAAGLSGVGFALMGIAAGLGSIGLAGFAAMPAIGMLIGLAAVAPALTGLMNAMSGGGEKGGAKEDKMDVLIGKVDQLIGVASQGGTINLDGRKVGDVIRLSVNSSNVR